MKSTDEALARAESLLDLQRPSDAEQIAREVLLTEPESARALGLLARSLLDSGRSEEAVDAASRSVAADSDNEYGYRILALAEIEAGHLSRAETAARNAVRIAPGMWQTHYTLGHAILKHHARELEALASARVAVELAPNASEPHNLAGMCLVRLGHTQQAQEQYKEAIRLDPSDAMALNNLAALKINNGSLLAASGFLRSGLSNAPQEKILQQNYDTLLILLVRRLYIALVITGPILYFMAQANLSYAVRASTTAALLVVYFAATSFVVHRLPRGAHLWASGLFRRVSGAQKVLIAGFVGLTLVVLAIGLAPSDSVAEIGIGGWIAVRLGVLIGGGLAVRARRQARRRGLPNLRNTDWERRNW